MQGMLLCHFVKRQVILNRSYNGDSDLIELWKHYANTGGKDKNTKVLVCNWLLALSIAISGFCLVQEIHSHILSDRFTIAILSCCGVIVSFLSSLVSLTYGGYANWNWA